MPDEHPGIDKISKATQPAWDTDFSSLNRAAAFAAKYFLRRSHIRFVISLGRVNRRWYIFPLSATSSFAYTDPRSSSTPLFAGTYPDFATLARSFPPDLFAAKPTTDDSTE